MTFHSLDFHKDNICFPDVHVMPQDAEFGKRGTKSTLMSQCKAAPRQVYMELHFLLYFPKSASSYHLFHVTFSDVALIFLPLKNIIPFICGPMTIAEVMLCDIRGWL